MATRTHGSVSRLLLIALAAACQPSGLPEDEVGEQEAALGVACDGAQICPSAGETWAATYRIGAAPTSRGELVQTFTATTAGLPTSVRVRLRVLRRVTNPAARVYLSIFDAATGLDGVDSATPVATASVPVASVTATETTFTFGPGDVTGPLVEGGTYALHLRTDDVGAGEDTLLVGVAALQVPPVSYEGAASMRSLRRQAGTPDPSVGLLLHFDGTSGSTTYPDASASPKVVTGHGGASIGTGVSRFGGASLSLDGTSGYLTVPHASDFDVSGGDFTIECFVYPTSTSNFGSVISKSTPGGSWLGPFDLAVGNGLLRIASSDGSGWAVLATGNTTVTPNQWHHLAFTRAGSTYTGWLDGQAQVQVTSSHVPMVNTNAVTVGAAGDTGPLQFFQGSVDEVRFTKGVARYTGAFTPPAAPFSGAGSPAFGPVRFRPAGTYKVAFALALAPPVTSRASCLEWYTAGSHTNGTYEIDPDGEGGAPPFDAYCDQESPGGGWTLVARIIGASAAHASAGAVSTLTSPSQGAPAKLSDALIDTLRGNQATSLLRLDCAAMTTYFQEQKTFVASTPGNAAIMRCANTWNAGSWFQGQPWPTHYGLNTYASGGCNYTIYFLAEHESTGCYNGAYAQPGAMWVR